LRFSASKIFVFTQVLLGLEADAPTDSPEIMMDSSGFSSWMFL